MSDLTRKLQLKPGQHIAILNVPADMKLDLADEHFATNPAASDGILAFARNSAELKTTCQPAVDAARRDALAWIAYPKAGQLDTDLNRDRLAESLTTASIQPVRQVALDEVWSALRFRPA
jgi:hypothetical protein